MLSTIAVIVVATPRFVIVVPLIVAFYSYVQNFFVPASRELKVPAAAAAAAAGQSGFISISRLLWISAGARNATQERDHDASSWETHRPWYCSARRGIKPSPPSAARR